MVDRLSIYDEVKSVQVPTPGIDNTRNLIGRDWLSTLVLPALGHKYSVARQLGLIVAVYLESPYRCWLFYVMTCRIG